MFHLFSYVWHVFVRHRRVWFSGLGFVVVMGVCLQVGMHGLNASLTTKYTKVQLTQKPSPIELRRIRRMQRMQARLERSKQMRAAAPSEEFPSFLYAVQPVTKVPDWGRMRTPDQWNRSYQQMTAGDFTEVPAYDLTLLTIPMSDLISPLKEENIPVVTAKLYYSTRFFGAYDIDSGEFQWIHAGVDLKLPVGTPIGAIGGGRVSKIDHGDDHFGMYVMVEHRLPEGTFYSIYGHLGSITVSVGQAVEPGQEVGTVGLTGKTTGAHVHLQIDKGSPGEDHTPVHFKVSPTREEAETLVINPISFIESHKQTLTVQAAAL